MEYIRAMTWNVWWRFGGHWRERERGILQTLRSVDPDVLGIQECWADQATTQADVLALALHRHAAFVEPGLPPVPATPEYADQDGVRMGIGLLSRWPVLRVESVPLPSADRGLVAMRARLEHPDGPLHVVVAATSWEPDKLVERAEQIAALHDLVLDRDLNGPLPVLLLGDLNADFSAPDLAQLRRSLVDTWGVLHEHDDEDPRTLSSQNRFAPSEAVLQYERRIDHVMARAGRTGGTVDVASARIVRDEFDGMPPSDHYAVVAELR
jgi:endonuclease/exonuclease/phosphatase family metal-dependent hydrolase